MPKLPLSVLGSEGGGGEAPFHLLLYANISSKF